MFLKQDVHPFDRLDGARARGLAASPSVLSVLARIPAAIANSFRIRQRAGLDRLWYESQTDLTSPVWRRFPELHYCLIGERAGLSPCSGFLPEVFADNLRDRSARNGDLLLRLLKSEIADIEPFDAIPFDLGGYCAEAMPHLPSVKPQSRCAIVVHVYYLDIWRHIASRLARLDFEFDLFITKPEGAPLDIEELRRVRGSCRQVTVLQFPNVGRDVLPFMQLVNGGVLDGYDAVCKLHTKTSGHLASGAIWRKNLLDGLLPRIAATQLLEAFLADETTLLAGPGRALLTGEGPWGQNLERATELMRRAGLTLDPEALSFIAGTMFWAKPELLQRLRTLSLTARDFENEAGQLDGTTAHAVERLIGVLASAGGAEIRTTRHLRENSREPSEPVAQTSTIGAR